MDYPHAIISGGSSGIGLALAERLIAKGWCLSLIARDHQRLTHARQHLSQQRLDEHQQINTISADVSDSEQVTRAAQAALDKSGPPQMLVTSAGIAIPGYFEELSLDVHRHTMEVNYFGTLYLIKALLPAMKRQRTGDIVLISSGAGLIGIYGYSAYSPTKFAMRGLGETLRAELKPYGIGVSIVYPPDTNTPQLHEENKTKPMETKAISAHARVWSAGAVADKILSAVNNKRFIISPGWEMTLLSLFHSLILAPMNYLFDHQIKKAANNK